MGVLTDVAPTQVSNNHPGYLIVALRHRGLSPDSLRLRIASALHCAFEQSPLEDSFTRQRIASALHCAFEQSPLEDSFTPVTGRSVPEALVPNPLEDGHVLKFGRSMPVVPNHVAFE